MFADYTAKKGSIFSPNKNLEENVSKMHNFSVYI